jgi:serine/threonine protein phosphatase 1
VKEYFIVGDIAGQYKTLVALLAQAPAAAQVVLVGDLVDRGPESNKVVELARSKGFICLKGNHEDMMVDFVLEKRRYHHTDWLFNGGNATIKSYLPGYKQEDITFKIIQEKLTDDAQWMDTLPYVFASREEGLIVTHAPILSDVLTSALTVPALREFDFLWNRYNPRQIQGLFQVHGHNAGHEVRWHKPIAIDEKEPEAFGVNLDCSGGKILAGMHWPSKKIYTQAYL